VHPENMTLRKVWDFFSPHQTNEKTTLREFPVFLMQSEEEDFNISFGVSWCIPAEKKIYAIVFRTGFLGTQGLAKHESLGVLRVSNYIYSQLAFMIC